MKRLSIMTSQQPRLSQPRHGLFAPCLRYGAEDCTFSGEMTPA